MFHGFLCSVPKDPPGWDRWNKIEKVLNIKKTILNIHWFFQNFEWTFLVHNSSTEQYFSNFY